MKNLKTFLTEIISHKITSIRADNVDQQFSDSYTQEAAVVQISFSQGKSITIESQDFPHFYGEGVLEIEEADMDFRPSSVSFIINEIKIWGYTPKGLNLFYTPPAIQIEFIESDLKVISIGFFLIGKELQFITGGYIGINFGARLTPQKDSRLILLYEI